ncbi:MAG: FAD-dependent oxidoreductase, partial [Planctomycetota bacterium]
PPAEYNLVAKGAAGQRGDVFSFCMCPGGQILPTNEVVDAVVTNGASRSKREGPLANCGLVLTLDPREMFDDLDPFKAVEYLERIEQTAFKLAGQNYRVPAQRACDFVQHKPSAGTLDTSYPLGGQWADIRQVIPSDVADAIAKAIEQLDVKLPGFGGPETLVTAPETRASSPLRMTRNRRTRQSASAQNLYPIGEGAGYAGGIVSAAIDGMKTAELIINRYKPIP